MTEKDKTPAEEMPDTELDGVQGGARGREGVKFQTIPFDPSNVGNTDSIDVSYTLDDLGHVGETPPISPSVTIKNRR